jgi:biopolymer transport protein TolQ
MAVASPLNLALPLGLAQPAVEPGGGILRTFAQAGPMAKVVLGLLVLFSLLSWAVILIKGRELARARRQSAEFLRAFRKRGASLREIHGAAQRLSASPLAGVFLAGYAEIESQIRPADNPGAHGVAIAQGAEPRNRLRSLPSLERSLSRAVHQEIASAARLSPFLATTASATPFIGLFGTVWGIMVAFQDIGLTGSTSLVTVAPGIAEALINTAAGLGAAIPALLAYNYFAQRLRQWRVRLDDFALEFLNLSERNFT